MTQTARQFQRNCDTTTNDADHRSWIRIALNQAGDARSTAQARFNDWDGACGAASQIKWESLDHLAENLESFEAKLLARGASVHWAETGEDACAYILRVAAERHAKRIVKSKCMTTEEIGLNERLEAAGLKVVESDLGEFIVQLRKEPPYHFVFPAMHLRRNRISETFEREIGAAPTEDAESLTLTARQELRNVFLSADIGISGANFGVADTGMISITENEGNARLTTSIPRIHIAVMGIEKVIPRLADLALLLPVLATSATGQTLTCYNTMIGGPRQPGEVDGPDEFHVILLDNGRTRLLADPGLRDALRCIRCGACLNICPVYRNIGGHAYDTTYQGPIGAVITPHLQDLTNWKHLAFASSLCGACTETCPVGIRLHDHLHHTRSMVAERKTSGLEAMMARMYAFAALRPGLFQWCGRQMRRTLRMTTRFRGGRLDPFRAWRHTRDLPAAPAKSFHDLWKERKA